ncbi:MAG: hypothetical protein ACJ75R_04590 [Solirubrobacterales bacterium]
MSAWWRPDRPAWWVGTLFAVGSILFLVPALAALDSTADWIGVTFFCGSIFFTAASVLQLVLAAELPHRLRPRAERRPLRPRAWLSATADWLSAAIQLPGTVLFNVNTFAAMNTALTTHQSNVRVWAPDAIGSGLFLVSSAVAFANTGGAWISWRPRDLDWWIAGLNLLGSVAFGASAIAAFSRPETGQAVSDQIANGGTALGALCFLIGALLLLPQVDRQEANA